MTVGPAGIAAGFVRLLHVGGGDDLAVEDDGACGTIVAIIIEVDDPER